MKFITILFYIFWFGSLIANFILSIPQLTITLGLTISQICLVISTVLLAIVIFFKMFMPKLFHSGSDKNKATVSSQTIIVDIFLFIFPLYFTYVLFQAFASWTKAYSFGFLPLFDTLYRATNLSTKDFFFHNIPFSGPLAPYLVGVLALVAIIGLVLCGITIWLKSQKYEKKSTNTKPLKWTHFLSKTRVQVIIFAICFMVLGANLLINALLISSKLSVSLANNITPILTVLGLCALICMTFFVSLKTTFRRHTDKRYSDKRIKIEYLWLFFVIVYFISAIVPIALPHSSEKLTAVLVRLHAVPQCLALIGVVLTMLQLRCYPTITLKKLNKKTKKDVTKSSNKSNKHDLKNQIKDTKKENVYGKESSNIYISYVNKLTGEKNKVPRIQGSEKEATITPIPFLTPDAPHESDNTKVNLVQKQNNSETENLSAMLHSSNDFADNLSLMRTYSNTTKSTHAPTGKQKGTQENNEVVYKYYDNPTHG